MVCLGPSALWMNGSMGGKLRHWFNSNGSDRGKVARAVCHAASESSVAVRMHGVGSTGFVDCPW